MNTPQKLWQCATFEDQREWVRKKLEQGATLSDPDIFLGGADPDKVIRSLRRAGMKIQTCYVKTVDASNEVHPKTLAWRLAKENSSRSN